MVKKILLFIKIKISRWKGRERYIKRSNNSEVGTYFIVRRKAPNVGLFSNVITTLGGIQYAVERGYIPVVDMQNYKNAYLSEENFKKKNAWEFYFEQPCRYSLGDLPSKCNIILGNMAIPSNRPNDSMEFFTNVDGELDRWKDIAKEYLRIHPVILEEINKEYTKLIAASDRVLGLSIRGTDYVKLRAKNHPIQPEIEVVIEDAKKMMKQYNCNKIFVATEEIKYQRALKHHFPDAFVTNSRVDVPYEDGYRLQCRVDREDDEYIQGKEYLTNIVMLSKCNCLLTSRTSGSVGALLLAEKYEHVEVYDLGVY